MNVTWNDKEIANPVLRVLVALLAGVGAVLGAALVVLVVGALLATCPAWIPLDLLLKHLGRRGFIVSEDGAVSAQFTAAAFRRQS